MKTRLDLPDDLMKAVEVQAAQENRRVEDIITDALRRELGVEARGPGYSIKDIKPVSAGEVLEESGSDIMMDMLDARGHRY